MTPTDKAQQMFLTLNAAKQRIAAKQGKEWTTQDEEALFIHCAKYHHIKVETLSKRFCDDFSDGMPS